MNSPTERPGESKKPLDQRPLPTQSPRELVEHAVQAMTIELMQLRRILWLAAKKYGPLTLNEAEVHPLWRLKKERPMPTILKLEADQIPAPTEEQLDQLAMRIAGSRMEIGSATFDLPIKDVNPVYLEMLLRERVRRNDEGFWIPVNLQPPPSDAR